MNIASNSPTIQSNPYPSREPGQRAGVIKRQDPVVYASPDTPVPVSRQQVDNYHRQGFMILEEMFSLEEVALWQEELTHLLNDDAVRSMDETIIEPNSREVRSIFAAHKLSSRVEMLARDGLLVRLAQYLLNDEVYIHQSRLNNKPGFRGKDFYWHSDFETWHVEDGMPNMRALSMSISLTENFSTNGPLLLIPGSHREFIACEGETPEHHFKSSLKKQGYGIPDDGNLSRLVEENGIVEFIGKPGSVCIFDCNLLHGSNSNISPYPRSNLFFVYNAISNRVLNPYSGQPPRPEFICTRENIAAITTIDTEEENERQRMQGSKNKD